MKILYLLFFSLFISFISFSQAKFSGKVFEEGSNEPLVGVNVYIPDLQIGEATDNDGSFIFSNIPNGVFNIQFSYLGYRTEIVEVHIHESELLKDVYLHPSVFHSQEIVVSGGRHSAQHENAIKIESFNQHQFQESANISILQSLASVPGVSLISKGTGIGTPVIRGLSTSNVLVLNNGIRLENFQFSENHPYQINEFGVERIEVVKGPASLLYGSDAIGGVLNVISENPPLKNKINGDANFSYNSNTKGINTNFGVKANRNNKFAGIRVGYKNHMDYTDGNNVFVPNSRFNEQNIKFFTGIQAANFNSRIYYDYNHLRPGLTIDPAVLLVSANERENKVWFQDLENHIVGMKNKIYLNRFKTEANLSYQNNHRRLYGVETAEEYKNVDMRLSTITADVSGEYDINTNQNVIIGIQSFIQHNSNGDAPEHVLPNFNLNDISLFGLYQIKNNERLFFQLGSRFDYRMIDMPEQEKTEHSHGEEETEEEHEGEEEMLPALNTTFGNYSFSTGLTYKLTEDFLIRSNFASAYRTPNIAELTQDGMHGNRYEQGDRNLNSQRNYEIDLSAHYHSELIMVELATFYNYINNYIHLIPTSDTIEDGHFIYKYIQANSELYGVEFGLDYHPIEVLAFVVNYSFTQGKKKNGEYLPFIPQNKLNSSIRMSLPGNLLKESYIKFAANYAFEQNKPSVYETKPADYIVFNLGFGGNIELSGQLYKVNVMVNNLMNQKYFDHLSTLKPLGFYNIGRNVNVSISAYFGN